MCLPNSPLFQHCQVYDWPPFFNKKCMNGPIFLDSYVKGPNDAFLVYAHIFRSQNFRGCLSSWYYMNWLWYLSNNQQKLVQKINGQYMNRSTFWMFKYMNGSVFSKARYMNGVGFEILARTPVPKLPLSYHPPPPQPREFDVDLGCPRTRMARRSLGFVFCINIRNLRLRVLRWDKTNMHTGFGFLPSMFALAARYVLSRCSF